MIAPAVWLLKEGSHNFFVLCVLWWLWVCLSCLHFECFTVEGQTGPKQSKNNPTKLQSKDIVCCILSCSESYQSLAVKRLPCSLFLPESSSSSQVKPGAGEPWSSLCETHEEKLDGKKQWVDECRPAHSAQAQGSMRCGWTHRRWSIYVNCVRLNNGTCRDGYAWLSLYYESVQRWRHFSWSSE